MASTTNQRRRRPSGNAVLRLLCAAMILCGNGCATLNKSEPVVRRFDDGTAIITNKEEQDPAWVWWADWLGPTAGQLLSGLTR